MVTSLAQVSVYNTLVPILHRVHDVDDNECEAGTSYCTQGCTNKDCNEGRYECFCNPGYILYSDDYTCIGRDIKYCRLTSLV